MFKNYDVDLIISNVNTIVIKIQNMLIFQKLPS